jgi:hypothetical protein
LVAKDELDLFAGILLEGGDDLPERCGLRRGGPLVPPHHEIGSLSAERRQHQRCAENGASNSDHVKSSHRQLRVAPQITP